MQPKLCLNRYGERHETTVSVQIPEALRFADDVWYEFAVKSVRRRDMGKPLQRKTVIVLSVGTVFSISVGAISAHLTRDWIDSLLILLGSEAVVLLLSALVLMHELWEDTKESLHAMSLLNGARDFVLDANDELFYERYRRLIREAEWLSSGSYTIDGESELSDDDVRSIDNLKSGEKLLSVCPFDYSDEETDVLKNTSYRSFIGAQYDAAKRGVSVHRIYIFRESSVFNQPDFQSHLKDCVEHGLDVGFLLLDNAVFTGAKDLPRDFIVFGERKVSVGVTDENFVVRGGEVFAARGVVESYIQQFNRLRRLSKPYETKQI